MHTSCPAAMQTAHLVCLPPHPATPTPVCMQVGGASEISIEMRIKAPYPLLVAINHVDELNQVRRPTPRGLGLGGGQGRGAGGGLRGSRGITDGW